MKNANVMQVAQPRELPLTVTERTPLACERQLGSKPKLSILGCAGVLGTITYRDLADQFDIRGLDLATRDVEDSPGWWKIGSIADSEALDAVISDTDYVLIAATGVKHGWSGLQEVEIAGTAAVCAAAARHKVKRLVLLSSNHATGMYEIDRWEGKQGPPATPASSPRPDGLYGSSKLFAEAVVRTSSEIYGLPASVIRLGAMRIDDNPANASDGPRPSSMSDSEYSARMRAVWMSHSGWKSLLLSELRASETFRLCYGSDRHERAPWSSDILTWSLGQ